MNVSEEDLAEYRADPIEVTLENSPGNPAFIDVTFTSKEYESAKTAAAAVSKESPEADIPEFGIHINMREWNLDNENDTVTVRQLPAKTCSVTGATLYTYDYSLESGQKEFATPVLVTVPIQGDIEAFEGVLSQNEETGKWEEDYYTLSDDNKTYTAYLTHFSNHTQKSNEKMLEKQKKAAIAAAEIYKEDGKSIFKLMPYEDQCKYQGVETWLYSIGLTKVPDFDNFLAAEDKYSNAVLKSLIDGSGGIPAEASVAQTCGTLGTVSDGGSTLQTVASSLNVINGDCAWVKGGGYALTVFGVTVLVIRISNQAQRGVSLGNILESNRWNIASAIVGICGAAAVAANAVPIATGAAVVSAGIFAGTQIKGYVAERDKKNMPLGKSSTLEEAVFKYYASDYDDGTENAVQRTLQRVINEIPPTDGKAHAMGYNTEINIRGTGWKDAFDFIFTHYAEDPVALSKAVILMYEEYEKYIDRFFDGLNGQAGDSSALREDCFRKYFINVLNTARYKKSENLIKSHQRLDAEANLIGDGFERDEAKRIYELIEKTDQIAVSENKTWNEVINAGYSGAASFDDIHFETWDKTKTDELKKLAMETLYGNTNPIIGGFYEKFHAEAVKEAREKLYNEILPWFNTQITFYIDDNTLDVSKNRSDTEYNTFVFTNAAEKPLFAPANYEAMKDKLNQGLTLKKNKDRPILLVTNVYNYLRWGSPTKVKVSKGGESIDGKADWSNVEFKIDENSLITGLPDKDRMLLSVAENSQTIRDMRVPITYGTKSADTQAAEVAGKYKSNHKNNDKAYNIMDSVYLACSDMTISIDKNGNFTESGSVKAEDGHSKTGATYSSSVTVSGKIDPATKTGTCTVSGSVNHVDSWSNTWTEQYSGWSSTFSSHGSQKTTCSFSGSGTISVYVPNTKRQAKSILLDASLDMKEKTVISGKTTYTNSYGNSGTVGDDSGPQTTNKSYTAPFTLEFKRQ